MYIKNHIYRQDVAVAVEAVPKAEKLNGKKFLITGATGLIASFIVDLLMYLNTERNAEIKIYALGRKEDRLRQRYVSYQESPWLDFIVQDVCTPLDFSVPVDYIVHAAGNGYPAAFREDPVGTMLPAVVGTYNILEYMRKHQAGRMVYVSSGEVYGQGTEQILAFEESYSGYVDSMDPRSCYPSAKRAAETLCASYYRQYHTQAVVARPAHTFGPNTTARDNRANTQFVRNVISNEDIVLKSSGTQVRSYTYVADCASGILTVLLHGRAGEAYNVANATEKVAVREFAAMAAAAGGRKCVYKAPNETELAERSPILYAALDTAKLQGLGWNSVFSVKTGVEHTLEILRVL